MKNFDLEAAKKGAKVCTRDGWPVRILCFDKKDDTYPIVALYEYKGQERFISYTLDGRFHYQLKNTCDLVMADDDYMEKLERGEYDHIGDTTAKVEDSRSLGNEWLNDMIKSGTSIFKDFERRLDIERQKYELSKLKHEADMLELERIPENWDYWRRMYAGMAIQAIIQEDPQELAYNHAQYAVIAADALIEELKKEKE